MEIQIAGSEEDRNELMPLLFVGSHREKNEIENQIKLMLKEYHHN